MAESVRAPPFFLHTHHACLWQPLNSCSSPSRMKVDLDETAIYLHIAVVLTAAADEGSQGYFGRMLIVAPFAFEPTPDSTAEPATDGARRTLA
jgi:hypothetical protein